MKKNVGKISHFEQITIKTFCKFVFPNIAQLFACLNLHINMLLHAIDHSLNQTFEIKSNYLIIHGRFIQTLFQQKNSVKMIWRN